MHSLRNFLSGITLLAAGFSCSSVFAADPYPSHPIHIIVPYAAGGTTDQIARALQQPLTEILKQPIIIENRPGAGGTIGADAVVRANPDGYTLLFGNTGPDAIVQLMREVPYDPLTDLRPISLAVITPMFLAVPADSPAKDLKEFIAYAKKDGAKLNIGSVGIGSLSHLSAEELNELAGTQLQHIPYNGGAPMMTAFLGGQIQVAFVTGLDGSTLMRAGKVKYLAIGTPTRSSLMPNLPPVSEEVPGFKSSSWFGLLGPKQLPDDIVKKLNDAIVAAVKRPEFQKLCADRNVEPRSSTPEELAHVIRDEVAQWGPVVKKANIKMD
jgi:tripartite-type tricarboxylate transporter receptor subunit TctC